MKATYVSVWDGGVGIFTGCEYDPITKVVSDIETVDVESMDLQLLDDEFVLYEGEEIRDFINEDKGFTYQDVQKFVEKFGDEVPEKESLSQTELTMDDHVCIKFEDKQYYVKEDNTFYTDQDYDIVDYLLDLTYGNGSK